MMIEQKDIVLIYADKRFFISELFLKIVPPQRKIGNCKSIVLVKVHVWIVQNLTDSEYCLFLGLI